MIKKEYAVLLFIIAVLVFYIYSEKGDKTHYELPELKQIETESISRLTVQKGDALIDLLKDDDTWLMEPQKYPADKSYVTAMLETVKNMKLTALASESKNYTLYNLDEKNRITITVYTGNDAARTVTVGKPVSTYGHTFILLDDDHRVYHAEGNFRRDFDKTVADLRDKIVLSIQDDITAVTFKKGGDELTIVKPSSPVSPDVTDKQEDAPPVQPAGPKWLTADNKAVKGKDIDQIVSALSAFRCDGFLEDKKKEEFTSPVYTVTLKGAKTYTVSFFEKVDNQYPAVSSESPYPFVVAEWQGDKIIREFKDLLEGTADSEAQ